MREAAMPKGLLIQPNGDYETRDINGLHDMHTAIGSDNLDWTSPGALTYICYGYALYEKAYNPLATALYRNSHPGVEDPLCGPVLVLGPVEGENETDIPEGLVELLDKTKKDFGPVELERLAVPLSDEDQMRTLARMSYAQAQAEQALKEGRAVDFGGIQIGRQAPVGDFEVPWEGSRRTGSPNL
jgi:hypothetical protein